MTNTVVLLSNQRPPLLSIQISDTEIVPKLSCSRGHPSYKATFSLQNGWLYKRVTTVIANTYKYLTELIHLTDKLREKLYPYHYMLCRSTLKCVKERLILVLHQKENMTYCDIGELPLTVLCKYRVNECYL